MTIWIKTYFCSFEKKENQNKKIEMSYSDEMPVYIFSFLSSFLHLK